MTSHSRVLFAVFASLLLVTAVPASAANTQLVVASQHSTDSEFQNAKTLQNLTVQGSGQSAFVNVTLSDEEIVPSGKQLEYQLNDDATPNTANDTSGNNLDGAITSATYVSSPRGSALDFDGSDDYVDAGDQPELNPGSNSISIGFWFKTTTTSEGMLVHKVGGGGGGSEGYSVAMGAFSADPGELSFRVRDGSNGNNNEIITDNTFNDGAWHFVVVEKDSGQSGASALDIYVDGSNTPTTTISDQGAASISSPHPFQIGAHQIENRWYFDGQIDTVRYYDRLLSASERTAIEEEYDIGQQFPAQYRSANHTVENASRAKVNISLTNASADVRVEYNNSGNGWTAAASATYTTSGNKSLDISGHPDETKWQVNITFSNQTGNGKPSASLYDESILFVDHNPQVENSTATPTGDLTTSSPTLQIDVNDREFSTVQGDSVDVKFFVDGTAVGTDTLSSNGTAQKSVSFMDGGSHTWHVEANDSYGLSNTSDTFTVNVPGTLAIREETPPHKKITSIKASFKFFEQNQDNPVIVNRTTSNGELDLSGLPVSSSFVVSIKAPGYHNRTVLIESIFDQETAFLLNKSRPTIEQRFLVEDRTGEYPPSETEIIVQKAINRSLYGGTPSGFSWTNVAGDDLGADQAFVTDLEEEDRYRLRVTNEDGDSRILGSHVAESTGTITLQVGRVDIETSVTRGVAIGATLENESGTPTVRYDYHDPEDDTTSLRIRIYNTTGARTKVHDASLSGPFGRAAGTIPLAGEDPESNFEVVFNATRPNDGDVNAVRNVGTLQAVAGQWGIDPQVLRLSGYVLIVLVSGLMVIYDDSLAAMSAFLTASFLTAIGVLDLHTIQLGAAASVSTVYLFARRGGI